MPSESPAASPRAAKPAKGLSTGSSLGALVTSVTGPGSKVRAREETEVCRVLSRSWAYAFSHSTLCQTQLCEQGARQ